MTKQVFADAYTPDRIICLGTTFHYPMNWSIQPTWRSICYVDSLLIVKTSDVNSCQGRTWGRCQYEDDCSPFHADFVVREEGSGVQGVLAKGGGRVYQWPPNMTIPAGGNLEWPFLLHPHKAGRLPLHCLWQYEPSPGDSGGVFPRLPFPLSLPPQAIQSRPQSPLSPRLNH